MKHGGTRLFLLALFLLFPISPLAHWDPTIIVGVDRHPTLSLDFGEVDSARGKKQLPTSSATLGGRIQGTASAKAGCCEIVIADYVGAPWQALQFHAQISSRSGVTDIQPGDDVADHSRWNVQTNLVRGKIGKNGERTDTIKALIFGNGLTTMPLARSSRLLIIAIDSAAAPRAQTIGIKISAVVGALPAGKTAAIHAGPVAKLQLLK